MAVTTMYAKLLGTYEPMPEEGVRKMKELIAADPGSLIYRLKGA